ncbi:hypothetical protein [Shewanella sp.]
MHLYMSNGQQLAAKITLKDQQTLGSIENVSGGVDEDTSMA